MECLKARVLRKALLPTQCKEDDIVAINWICRIQGGREIFPDHIWVAMLRHWCADDYNSLGLCVISALLLPCTF